jgi:hypothetical protein
MRVVGTVAHFEWEYEWAPAWQTVGKHIRYVPYLVARAKAALRTAFDLGADESLPPVSASSSPLQRGRH